MPGKTALLDIFEDMSYKQSTQEEGLAKITSWLPNSTISSIVDGKWTTIAPDSTFSIKNSDLKVALLSSHLDLSKLSSKNDVTIDTHLSKFNDKNLLISLSLNIPLWQVHEKSKQGKASEAKVLAIVNEEDIGVIVDINLSSRTFSLESVFMLLKSISTDSTKKFIFVIQVNSEEDVFRLLPIVYEICLMNVGAIKNNPIDILLCKEVSEDAIKALQRKHGSMTHVKDINSIDFSKKNEAIISGGFEKRSFGYANHFIVGSSADLKNAVEAIGQKVWLSGSESSKLYRSLLFVHQPNYKTVIELLELKLNSLKISETWKNDSDFIKIARKDATDILHGKKLPLNGDLRGPTIIFDIGTSTDIVASTSQKTGLGHLLAVIPYRSNTELLSLANNHGSHNDVFLFCNNIKDIKDICKSIKGYEVRVNICSQKVETPRSTGNVWGAVGQLIVQNNTKESHLSQKDLLDLIKKSESAKSSVSLPSNTISQTTSDAESFVLRFTKPIGLCALVLGQEHLDTDVTIQLISSLTAAGNAVIGVSAASKVDQVVLQKCSKLNCYFAEAVAKSVNDALNMLASTGKINLAVVYNDGEAVSTEHLNSFSNFIVSRNGEIDSNLFLTNKVVYM